jgi:hypothetical protein
MRTQTARPDDFTRYHAVPARIATLAREAADSSGPEAGEPAIGKN